jgi:glycolate oxidase iron-sulfur subunit
MEFPLLDPCVHCGFCLPTCASYRVLGTEMDSPRGRIHSLKALAAGELELDATVASHFDSCLGCFACVSACPAGVRYDELLAEVRPKLNRSALRSPWQMQLRGLLMNLLPYPQRLRALLQPFRLYGGSRLQQLARISGITKLFGPEIAAMEKLLPQLPKGAFGPDPVGLKPAEGEWRARVGLVLGCVQRVFDPEVNAATLAVLAANGVEVVVPPNQGCCGAVCDHQGQQEQTANLAAELVQAFNRAASDKPLDAILVAASGCGHTLKQYPHLLRGQPQFNAPVLDVHEFLSQLGLSAAFKARLKSIPHSEVVFHDACHMIHGQGIRHQPRQLLEEIPGLKLKEAVEAGVCCGSAGIYNLVQPAEAAALGEIKVNDLCATGATVVASANIGCSLQIRQHMENQPQPLKVLHPMQLLAESAGLLG